MDKRAAAEYDRQTAGILALGVALVLLAAAVTVGIMHLLIVWLTR